ncbi:MAG: L,D-transpeptidase family protein [Arcobacteraceae bacterium]|nr:L,D-transpeptidase family protein [Arcobacteraceae bacterium]
MNIIRLLFICIILLSSYSYGISKYNVKAIQNDFYTKVVKTNIYKKRFTTYLNRNCPNDDNLCYQKKINMLSQWDTVQNDISLKNIIDDSNKVLFIDEKYWQRITTQLLSKINNNLGVSQFVSLIDLSKQLYILTLWNNIEKKFYLIGSDLISSGDMQREANIINGDDHYFNTPTGILKVKEGWRSDGKILDDNFTLPYGKKNRYIFYFGKKNGIRYNTFDNNGNKIEEQKKWNVITDSFEFAMHAHRSTNPLGMKVSHGCIRMSNDLNLFLDNNLVLHKNIIDGKKWLPKYSQKPKTPQYYELAGEYLIIFDKI